VSGESLANKETAVKVSTNPSSSATFVGTTACLGCHPSYATEKQILHKLGIMVPGSPSGLQDLSKFGPTDGVYNYSAGLAKFTAEQHVRRDHGLLLRFRFDAEVRQIQDIGKRAHRDRVCDGAYL
jgi:hypothetical protein